MLDRFEKHVIEFLSNALETVAEVEVPAKGDSTCVGRDSDRDHSGTIYSRTVLSDARHTSNEWRGRVKRERGKRRLKIHTSLVCTVTRHDLTRPP